VLVRGGSRPAELDLEAVEAVFVVIAAGVWFRHVDRLANRLVGRAREAARQAHMGFGRALVAVGRERADQEERTAPPRKAEKENGNLVADLEHARREGQGW
jgi:hypothetical protein